MKKEAFEDFLGTFGFVLASEEKMYDRVSQVSTLKFTKYVSQDNIMVVLIEHPSKGESVGIFLGNRPFMAGTKILFNVDNLREVIGEIRSEMNVHASMPSNDRPFA